MPYTNPAATVFAPTTGGGAARGADMGEAQLWGTEVEQAIKQSVGAAHKARLVAVSNVSVVSGLQPGTSLDGKTLVKGDPVLLTGQTAPAQNGLYIVPTLGDAPSRAWAFSYYDSMPGTFFIVIEGTTYGQTIWRCTSVMGGTLGVTALAFTAELARANTWAGVQTFSAVPVLSGGGIKFPATQVPSSDPNTLDDYEEVTGNFTATFATPGDLSVVYTVQGYHAIKIGRLVFIRGGLTFTPTWTTASGNFLVAGFPWAAETLTGVAGILTIGNISSPFVWPASATMASLSVLSASTNAQLSARGSAVAGANFTIANLTSGASHVLSFSGVYLAA